MRSLSHFPFFPQRLTASSLLRCCRDDESPASLPKDAPAQGDDKVPRRTGPQSSPALRIHGSTHNCASTFLIIGFHVPQTPQLDAFMADLQQSGLLVGGAAAEASAAPASGPTAAGRGAQATASAGDLPPGWLQAADPETGEPYYFRPETGEVTWARPVAGAQPPGAAAAAAGVEGGAEAGTAEDGAEGTGSDEGAGGEYEEDDDEDDGEAAARMARLLAVDVSALGSLVLASIQESVDRLLGAGPHPSLQARLTAPLLLAARASLPRPPAAAQAQNRH